LASSLREGYARIREKEKENCGDADLMCSLFLGMMDSVTAFSPLEEGGARSAAALDEVMGRVGEIAAGLLR
ncbi:MAG: hypothetical protein IJL69_01190, partial [Oscillospiraceae bacterium]|nr:hypothetical protein [Oscillospiraceae bacterium]